MTKDKKKEIIQKLGITIGSSALKDNKTITPVINIQKGKDIEQSRFLSKNNLNLLEPTDILS